MVTIELLLQMAQGIEAFENSLEKTLPMTTPPFSGYSGLGSLGPNDQMLYNWSYSPKPESLDRQKDR